MSTAVRRAIYGQLSGDTTLTNMLGTAATGYSKAIYHDPAPQSSAFPFVVLSKSAGTPTEAFGKSTSSVPAGVAFDTDVWLIKAVDHNTTADKAESIAARIQALLNDASLSISGGTLIYLRRQSDFEDTVTIDGEMYRQVGSYYRLIHQ